MYESSNFQKIKNHLNEGEFNGNVGPWNGILKLFSVLLCQFQSIQSSRTIRQFLFISDFLVMGKFQVALDIFSSLDLKRKKRSEFNGRGLKSGIMKIESAHWLTNNVFRTFCTHVRLRSHSETLYLLKLLLKCYM